MPDMPGCGSAGLHRSLQMTLAMQKIYLPTVKLVDRMTSRLQKLDHDSHTPQTGWIRARNR